MPTTPPPTENITITVPKGTRLRGSDLQIICTPSKWTDVATFLLANYIAHAATVKSVPGQSLLSVMKSIICSLLFPVSGVRRGVNAIYQHAIFAKSPLEAAAKAGALCMVVRTLEWRPERGDVVKIIAVSEQLEKPRWLEGSRSSRAGQVDPSSRAERVGAELELRFAQARKTFWRLFVWVDQWQALEDEHESNVPAYIVVPYRATKNHRVLPRSVFQPLSSSCDADSRNVHGVCQLPSGYGLCIVPPGAQVVELDKDQQRAVDHLEKIESGGKDTTDNKAKSEDRDHSDIGATTTSLYSRFKTQISSKRASRISSLNRSHSFTTQLSSVNNLAKGLIAIFQTIYASFTLYNARGDQIQHYGYAAFGLTVLPYICMSIINLASTILTPDYPMLYLVESEVMDEAKKRQGAKFEGVVGRILTTGASDEFSKTVKFDFNGDSTKMVALVRKSDGDFTEFDKEAEMGVGKIRTNPWARNVVYHIPSCRPFRMISQSSELPPTRPRQTRVAKTAYALALIPLVVNGILSHFSPRQSTFAQRAWTMTWLALGTVSSRVNQVPLLIVLVYSVPAIGGFVVVSQMIMQYGTCERLA